MGVGVPELLVMLVFMLGALAVLPVALYWLIRLAVRHAIQDAARTAPIDQRHHPMATEESAPTLK